MSLGVDDRGQQHVDELAIAAGEPRSPTLLLYPHLRPSLEPGRLRRGEILAVAEEARRQLCREPRSKVEKVDGLAFEVSRELDQSNIGQLSATK